MGVSLERFLRSLGGYLPSLPWVCKRVRKTLLFLWCRLIPNTLTYPVEEGRPPRGRRNLSRLTPMASSKHIYHAPRVHFHRQAIRSSRRAPSVGQRPCICSDRSLAGIARPVCVCERCVLLTTPNTFLLVLQIVWNFLHNIKK